jgi:hypothetical protein
MHPRLPDFLLGESFALADLVVEFPACHVVEDEDDAVLLLVDLVDVDDAGVVQPHQHFQLVTRLHQEGFVYLGGEGLASVPADDLPDGRLRAVCVQRGVRPRISFSS